MKKRELKKLQLRKIKITSFAHNIIGGTINFPKKTTSSVEQTRDCNTGEQNCEFSHTDNGVNI